ncbi:MAG TPA: TAT-variant-translocated molybdopterin oxidoreductase [Thermoanaerobaculia bacterium]|jgi:molybdopterin-containing oxidoreductase family iron-sulfur binding subunit|nr:TAT-variant-translocated molybdopterin oxidoreductase [Thermoanaerobaculia bacterium]
MIEPTEASSVGEPSVPAAGSCGPGCGCGAAAEPLGSRREHWRSLEALAGTDESREFMEREFPVGASELPEGIDRRTLVQLLGASLALAGATGCRRPVENIVPFVTPPEETVPGIPKHYATTMPFGTDGYGLLVESHEGRPTKIEGNELHPATAGSASAQMQASILGLYDPDRSQHVLAGKEKKTWADFVAAWKTLETDHLANGGAGLAVLSLPSSSPTLFRLAGAFRTRFPQARWATWEPVNDENALAGASLLSGRPLKATYDIGAAKVILSLDADLLLGESGAVANARGFAAGRRLVSEKDTMNRLWVVESAHTTTGAMADHRLALPSRQIGPFALALGAALAASGVAVALPAAAGSGTTNPLVPPRWIEVLAKDLAANPGASLVVAGRHQPPAVHALALAINAALGNLGTTIFLREPVDVLAPSTADLASLVAGMNGGQVSTLVVLGANPCFDAPADLGFEKALAKVKNVVHLGLAEDETAAHAGWHLPEAHFLEGWGDCRAADGTASVVQPLIEPLFGGHSAIELVGLFATGEDKPGHDLLLETWKTLLPATPPSESAADPDLAFETSFNKVLHDGLLAGSASPPVALAASALPAEAVASLAAPVSPGIELSFRPSPAVHDGRFANVGWLQELPDAVTKITWGNAALLAPKTAERLKLANEDGVRLTLGGAKVELPVWIVPGQAEETVVVHLGYGRRISGRVGTGVGANVYPLRTVAALGFVAGVKVEPSGQDHRIAQTQDHGTMEGRPIVREATLEEWRREPDFAPEMVEIPKSDPLWVEHKYDHGPQWAMAIDLNACTGCNACVIACQSENNVPIVGHEQVRRGREMHWLRIDRYFSGSPERPEMVFQPMPCQQCENAPCEQVCPVAATVHTAEGLNAMVYNRCIGTRYCSNNCPYKVRRFNFFNYTKDTPELLKLAANPDVTVRSRGVMEKCTYCVQRIQRAKIDAKMAERPLKDGDVRTACQQTCPSQAIVFGDIHPPETQVNAQKRNSRNYVLLAELGNKPRTSYLARIRNPHPELPENRAEA